MNIKLKELGRASWTSDRLVEQSYLRGCAWSPDGKSLLTAINRQGLKIVNLPEDLLLDESQEVEMDRFGHLINKDCV